jgi:hypothetical protein
MRSYRRGLLVPFLFLAVPAWPQQTISSQPLEAQPAPQDPQAVTVISQAIVAAGGLTAFKAISDYTAIGNITYHRNPQDQGTATIRGLGLTSLRLDASLQSGLHSEVQADGRIGTKTPNGTVAWFPPYTFSPGQSPTPIPSSEAFPYQSPKSPGAFVVPSLRLPALLGDPTIKLSYMGTTYVDGHMVLDIQAQETGGSDSMSLYNTTDYFVDPITLQLLLVQDMVPKNVVHQIRYSNYRVVNAVLVPFSILEAMGGQTIRDIQLSQVAFNSGLQDSAFIF